MKLSIGKLLVTATIVLAGLPFGSPSQAAPVRQSSDACATDAALWIGTGAGGLNCLDATGLKTYTNENNQISSNLISAIAVCDKKVYVAAAGLDMWDGSAWSSVKIGFDLPEVLACDGKGGLWAGYFQGVSHFDGTAWTETTTASKQLGTGTSVDLIKDIAVAPNGDAWVVTANSIAVQQGGKWTVYEKGNGFTDDYFFEKIAIDSKGQVWALQDSGLLKFDGKTWQSFAPDNFGTPVSMAIDSKGQVWVGTVASGIEMFDGTNWKIYNHASNKLSSDHVRAIAFDSQGRLWAGTEWGLNVLNGDTFASYQMGNSELADNSIRALVAIGKGPTLPATKDKKPGTLGGRIINKGDPVANTKVQLCPQGTSLLFSGDSPCADDPYNQIIQTGSDGTFKFTNLPPGRYAITAYDPVKANWVNFGGDGSGNGNYLVYEGKDAQIGDVDLSKAS